MRLLVAISSHGFGHAMQACIATNALRARLPELEVVIRTQIPRSFLDSILDGFFTLLRGSPDFGMVMNSAIKVDAEKSADAYKKFHTDWKRKIEREAADLAAVGPDLLLADIPYLTLAGARQAGIPSIALCSLNWADIYRGYCGHRPEAENIVQQIHEAYQSAHCFLQPAPHMPMKDLDNTKSIGPLGRIGVNRRETICRQLNLNPDKRLVLTAMGGIEMQLPIQERPDLFNFETVHILSPSSSGFKSLEFSFLDILCSCDAIITKPGYGTFTEAACNGIPVLYLEREDWPETVYLTNWLKENGVAQPISRTQLEEKNTVMKALDDLFECQMPEIPEPSGAREATDELLLQLK
ncbi:MAG: hypothetical protein GY862_11850 [Gammaproteobacteria bacterium]|nr:hypothetical protein [Gammaproteobacteria bacterium]